MNAPTSALICDVDLGAAPFSLDADAAAWVESTLASLSLDEKIGQMFCLLGLSTDLGAVDRALSIIQPGAYMLRPAPGATVQRVHRHLQESSEIPVLLAANLERGGNGIAVEGTEFGSPLQVAATDDEEHAYRLGLVCGREGAAVGCNWNFSPILDIDFNFHNPITNIRTYGSDIERVRRMATAFVRGQHDAGMAVTAKHWPGDGVDGRDQHLVTAVNTQSVEEWEATFGEVYRAVFAEGAEAVMAAHIMQPAYSRLLLPGVPDSEFLPASLAHELTTVLLRERLGFNGLVITDATTMVGYMGIMPRALATPTAIAAGCDQLCFSVDLAQDVRFIRDGLESGLLTTARLDQAVTRVLALKASLGLHERKREGTLVPDERALEVLGCEEHKTWARACADRSVTLVKDTQDLLPLDPARHHRVLLHVLGDVGGYQDDNALPTSTTFAALLEARGFEVTRFIVPGDAEAGWMMALQPVSNVIDSYDLILYYASIKTLSNQTIVRITWGQPMGLDAPKHITEVPTLFVSVDNPYHLQDVPRIPTFVNGYTGTTFVVEAVVEKLLGDSPFHGVSPVDPFCGLWDARL
jgi:beta-N-acetylhexosaminidase